MSEHMNFEQFQEYIRTHIYDYLPEEYEKSDISFSEVLKNGDVNLTGLLIRKAGQHIAPSIYLNSMYADYCNGRDIDELVREIADMRVKADVSEEISGLIGNITDYSKVKDKLTVHICDTEDNRKRLKSLAHREYGDFSATYHILLTSDETGSASTAVTKELLKIWDITMEQVHKDAQFADMMRGTPGLYRLEDLMIKMVTADFEPKNYLEYKLNNENCLGLYCLTVLGHDNAAALLFDDEVMKRVGERLGCDFYILPSSLHEVLILPATDEVDTEYLSSMVKEINRNEVQPQDRLSDHVQIYRVSTGTLERAV